MWTPWKIPEKTNVIHLPEDLIEQYVDTATADGASWDLTLLDEENSKNQNSFH